jgi:hypothetical protein
VLVEEREAAQGPHTIRNYLVFAILTVVAICGAALLLGREAARQKKTGVGSFSQVTETCSLTGRVVKLPEVSEASGLALSRGTNGLLWTHEDSRPVLFALDALGRTKGRVVVSDAPVQDWEDLAIGPCEGKSCLFIADIGDNNGKRERISVYRVPEPLPTDPSTAPAQAFHATYPDGPQDAEALFVSRQGGIYLVTKGNSGPIALYKFPEPLQPGASVTLQRVATLLADGAVRNDRVTGAATSPDGQWVVLRTHDAVLFYEAGPLLGGTPRKPLRYHISLLQESQAEGVAVGNEGSLFLVSEGGAKDAPGLLAHGVCKLPSRGGV